MKDETKRSLTKFFSIYLEFTEVELYNSLLEDSIGRCSGLLYETMRVFSEILKEYLTQDESDKLLKKLKDSFDSYKLQSSITPDKKHFAISGSRDMEYFIDKDFIKLFEIFYVAMIDFQNILSKAALKSEIKERFGIEKSGDKPLFVQALLEFNNALSHISVALYHNDVSDTHKNIKRAKSHIYRASLDCYKMLLRFVFVQDSNKILQDYKKCRCREFLGLGGLPKDKYTLIEEYKEIVNQCIAH